MLTSHVLKLRLDRIEQQGHYLSVKDQLRLVTLEQPELTADFYSQLFQPTLPKNWHFQHATPDEINTSLRLIELIYRQFIPAYSNHAQRYAWFEQGLAFQLQYTDPSQHQVDLPMLLHKLDACQDSPLKLSILKQLHAENTELAVTLALAGLYKRLQEWSLAIDHYQAVFRQQALQSEDIHYDFVECLLHRNHYSSENAESDVVQALQYLGNIDHIQQHQRYEQLSQWAVSLMLPEHLQNEQPHTVLPLRGLQSKLKFVGYSLNHWLTSSEFILPYYQHIVEGAPVLLDNHDIIVSLDRHKPANQALQKMLSGRDLKLISGISASHYSLGLIWNYLQINPLVLDALVAAAQGNPEVLYNLKQIPAPDYDHDTALSHLCSYLAKQQVAYNLSQQGHSIEFVEHSHLAGFDLIVDGTPMQVRCTLAADQVEKFAQSHPHIAVIVNIELAHLQEKYPSVFADLALSYSAVQRTAQTNLQYKKGLDDYLPIPLMNTGFAVYRNFRSSQSTTRTRPYFQYRPSASVMKNGLAMGVAIGGVVSGSIGALVVSSFSLYRTWRVQRVEQRKSEADRQQQLQQFHELMDMLIDFAEWFNQHLLKYRVDLYAYQLQQIEMKLMGKIPEAVISTTLFAYKFEAYQRALKLHEWMQKQLAYDHPRYKVQAGWVALAQSQQFMSIELKQRVARLNAALEKYKHMTQYGGQWSHLTRQGQQKNAYQLQDMQISYQVPSQPYRS